MDDANNKLCDSCTYSSAEGYCGNGALPLVDTNYCTYYEEGPCAIPNRGRPHWDHPDPILPHQRQRVTGCRVIPINWDGNCNYGTYCLYLDRYHPPNGSVNDPHNPGDAMVIDMLQVMEGFSWVVFLLREGCRFDSAYGKQYMDRVERPAQVSVRPHVPPGLGWGDYKVRAYLQVVVWIPETRGSWHSGTAAHEVPEQYWWLDPTLPPSTLHPMHQLLISTIKQVSDCYLNLTPHNLRYDQNTSTRDAITSLLMDTLNLGLELRGRPLEAWLMPVDTLHLKHFNRTLWGWTGLPTEGSIRMLELHRDAIRMEYTQYGGRPHG